jgi:hypothetical protein
VPTKGGPKLRAAEIVTKLLTDRLTFTPETMNGVAGFRVRGAGSFLKFLDELIPGFGRIGVLCQIPAEAVSAYNQSPHTEC